MLPRDVISSGSLILRPPAEDDAEAIVKMCDDPVTARFVPSLPQPYEAGHALDHVRRSAGAWQDGGARYAVTEGGRFAGLVWLEPPDRWDVSGVGFMVAPWARGRGVAATAVRALTDWALDHGVRRVELQAEVENVACLRAAYRAGFREEGLRREARRLRDGRFADYVVFARLRGRRRRRWSRSCHCWRAGRWTTAWCGWSRWRPATPPTTTG
ncbi:GNAT family N-acetyltransferase [Nonomuraea thailandensis]